jgi:hypothetical protein
MLGNELFLQREIGHQIQKKIKVLDIFSKHAN